MEQREFDYLLEKRLAVLSPELSGRYRQCMSIFDVLLEKFHQVFPTFTDHSLLHCMNVLNYSNMIIGENVHRLNADEIYVYLTAVALHDSGMSIDEKRFEEYVQKSGVSQYVKDHPEESHASVSRRFHHDFSAVFIRENRRIFEIPDDTYADAIARVARGHRRVDLSDRNLYPTDYRIGNGEKVNLAVLGAFLRVADEMDTASDRNSRLLYDVYISTGGDAVSRSYFEQCEAIKKVCCEDDRVCIYCCPPDTAILEKIREYAEGLREKLCSCRDVILSSGDLEFPYREVSIVVSEK